MNKPEIIDVLNDDGEVVDTINREEAERDNHISENVLIFVFNSIGKVWVQLRPKSKNHYPGLWDISACGGVMSGEPHEQAARRETQEEMGLDVKLRYVESFLNIFPGDNGEERKRLSHLYIGVSDEIPEANDEVDEFKLWDPAELGAEVLKRTSEYVPSFIVELDKAVEGRKKLKS